MISLKRQITWTHRLQWTIGSVALCGLLAYYLGAHRPHAARMNQLGTSIIEAEQNLARNEEAARDLEAIKRDVNRLREQITLSRQLPAQEDLPKFIREITQLSKGVSLQQFRVEPEKVRLRELCGELPIDFTFTGKFTDVAAFLRQAEEMPRMLRTRKLQLRSRDGKAGDVDVRLSMSIFYADGK